MDKDMQQMKELVILLFKDDIEMIKSFHDREPNIDLSEWVEDNWDDLSAFLNTLAKCVISDEYYQEYLKYNKEILERR